MARRYDSRTTIFSPEGRLFQVEYAMEAIGNAGACLGLLAKDGAVLVAEKKVTSKLLDTTAVGVRREKMYALDDHVTCAVAGITSDANILVGQLRAAAQRYRLAYSEPMPVEQLVRAVCDTKQGYTQFGGQRPFGVSLLYAGWDAHHGWQLYQSDPSGNYGGWKACAIGNGHGAAQNLLKTEYKEGLTLQEAVDLAVRVLAKSMDSSLAPEKVEMVTVRLADGAEGGGPALGPDGEPRVVRKIYEPSELAPLLEAANKAKEEEAAAAS